VLNLEHISIPEACDVVCTMVRQKCFEFTHERQAAMDDLVLASRVRAKLALNSPTSDLEVEVAACGGLVSIRGRLSSSEQLKEVERVASAVPGVTALNLDGLGSKVSV
jgi:osmotically-inducible protein OsmY